MLNFLIHADNFLRTVENFKPDVIFNALHGRFGEDGYIQSVLEIWEYKIHSFRC